MPQLPLVLPLPPAAPGEIRLLDFSYNEKNVTNFIWSRYKVPDGRICYNISGVLVCEILSKSNSWSRQTISIQLPIPELPNNTGLWFSQVVPLFTINAMSSVNVGLIANNQGQAVDSFRLTNNVGNNRFGQNFIAFDIDIAVKGVDTFLHRIGFTVTFLGHERPLPPPPPPI
jgi:hypothetical protein